MKVRQGFVSNSSSSSFVVAFPRQPRNAEDLQSMMFGGMLSLQAPYYDEQYPIEQVAATVFKDIKDQQPMTQQDMAEELSSPSIYREGGQGPALPEPPDYPKGYGLDDDERERAWDEHYRQIEERGKALAKMLVDEAPGCVFYKFSYADEDGSYFAALEHGRIFRNLPSFRISNH